RFAMWKARDMSKPAQTAERIEFRRHRQLPGLEALLLRDSDRCFSCYSADYEFIVPGSWCGEVRHGKHVVALEPGAVLCTRPGDAFGAQRGLVPGSIDALLIEPSAFGRYLEEHDVHPGTLTLRGRPRLSPELARQLRRVFEAFQAECSALEIQS